VALLRTAIQSSTYDKYTASLAVDGGNLTRSSTGATRTPWWSVDLGTPIDVGRVCITNDRLNGKEHLYNRRLTAFNQIPWMLWTGGNARERCPPIFRRWRVPHYFSESNHLHLLPV